jgi:hypothetical protein
MSDVPISEQKILFIRSGNRCAFPGCDAPLTKKTAFGTRVSIIGQIAHIVSETPEGPRGKHALGNGEHNRHTNLLFLCSPHHKEVDDHPEQYTVERLRQMKAEHEDSVERAVVEVKQKEELLPDLPLLSEIVHSTLLPISRMPKYIFSAPCKYGDSDEKLAAKDDALRAERIFICPFIIREGNLFAFNDLRLQGSPFRKIINQNKVRISSSDNWLQDSNRSRWFMSLLSRSLNKLTGRKGLRLDKEHHRYFFQSDEPGRELAVKYRPLNQSITSRKVVWRPVRKKTNEPRQFWVHLAVNLRFLNGGHGGWCLCIRPEMRITKDGAEAMEPEKIGKHVTRQMAHEFNYDLLENVNFWRDYLSDGQPRIILKFGERSAVIASTTLMSSVVNWPGIPEEFAKPFANIDYEENLFTSSELEAFGEEEFEDVTEAELTENE